MKYQFKRCFTFSELTPMKLIQKIKTFFIKNDFHSWKDFDLDKYEIKFEQISDEILIDMAVFITNNLTDAKQIGITKHRLNESAAQQFGSINALLTLVRQQVQADCRETTIESLTYNWNFQYFMGFHERCENTIRICNVLRSNDGTPGTCVYPIITIRKFEGNYYCWNHAN